MVYTFMNTQDDVPAWTSTQQYGRHGHYVYAYVDRETKRFGTSEKVQAPVLSLILKIDIVHQRPSGFKN